MCNKTQENMLFFYVVVLLDYIILSISLNKGVDT